MFYINQTTTSVAVASEHLLTAAAKRGMTPVGRHVMKWHEIQSGAEHGPECHVYDFCNATWMRQSLEADQLTATALPCRVAVYEDSTGVKLSMLKLAGFLAAATSPHVHHPFAEMEQLLIDAIREVCNGRAGEFDPVPAEATEAAKPAAALSLAV